MNWIVSQNNIIEKLIKENRDLKDENKNLSEELVRIKKNLREKNNTLMWFSLTSELVIIAIGFIAVKKLS